MRLHYLFSLGLLACLGTASGLSLSGCTAKTDVGPDNIGCLAVDCGTVATVRLCLGKTLMCPTEHTTLELADGTRLRPGGSVWEAYELHQLDGQMLRIGYTLGAPVAPNEPGSVYATLFCLEEGGRSGTGGQTGK